jgi:hypothetical protein
MFAKRNIGLHLDVGSRYDPNPGLNPVAYDLGGGGDSIPFVQVVPFEFVYPVKAQKMRPRRWNTFRYYLHVADSAIGAAGQAELGGNDGMLYFGTLRGPSGDPQSENAGINDSSLVFGHEFGHSLNLQHGGFEEAPYKPNYQSIMAYIWRYSLPLPGSEAAWYRFSRCGDPMPDANSPYKTPPALFVLDFSDGTRAPINEASLSESLYDFNCSGAVENGYSLDVERDGTVRELRDYNDWANLKYVFHDSNFFGPRAIPPLGQTEGAARELGAPVMWDRGYVVPEPEVRR